MKPTMNGREWAQMLLAATFITLAASDFQPLWTSNGIHKNSSEVTKEYSFDNQALTVADAWRSELRFAGHETFIDVPLALAQRIKEAESASRGSIQFPHLYLFPPTHKIRTPNARGAQRAESAASQAQPS